ncbi:hypothetical protein KJ780_05385 [Candidatus Micrarchaeota archaeon]|nr:hypothetical protein [Candidatus Micrarchaeota archaeon]
MKTYLARAFISGEKPRNVHGMVVGPGYITNADKGFGAVLKTFRSIRPLFDEKGVLDSGSHIGRENAGKKKPVMDQKLNDVVKSRLWMQITGTDWKCAIASLENMAKFIEEVGAGKEAALDFLHSVAVNTKLSEKVRGWAVEMIEQKDKDHLLGLFGELECEPLKRKIEIKLGGETFELILDRRETAKKLSPAELRMRAAENLTDEFDLLDVAMHSEFEDSAMVALGKLLDICKGNEPQLEDMLDILVHSMQGKVVQAAKMERKGPQWDW